MHSCECYSYQGIVWNLLRKGSNDWARHREIPEQEFATVFTRRQKSHCRVKSMFQEKIVWSWLLFKRSFLQYSTFHWLNKCSLVKDHILNPMKTTKLCSQESIKIVYVVNKHNTFCIHFLSHFCLFVKTVKRVLPVVLPFVCNVVSMKDLVPFCPSRSSWFGSTKSFVWPVRCYPCLVSPCIMCLWGRMSEWANYFNYLELHPEYKLDILVWR